MEIKTKKWKPKIEKYDKKAHSVFKAYNLSYSRKIFIEIKKTFGTHLSARLVLLTKFGFSVSSGLRSWFGWKPHHGIPKTM